MENKEESEDQNLDLSSKEAAVAMKRLGYVSKDLQLASDDEVPLAFSHCKSEYTRIYSQ